MSSLSPSAQSGFTLIELLVVIAIIGILAAAAVPQILDAICDSRVSAAKSNISTVRTALVQCQMEDGCDQTSLSSMANHDLISGQINGDFTITSSGGSVTEISSVNQPGCEWNSGTATENGITFYVDNGEFVATP